MKSKFNVGLKLSKDFQSVNCEFVEEEIEYKTTEEMQAKIRQKFTIMKNEIDLQFEKMGIKK